MPDLHKLTPPPHNVGGGTINTPLPIWRADLRTDDSPVSERNETAKPAGLTGESP